MFHLGETHSQGWNGLLTGFETLEGTRLHRAPLPDPPVNQVKARLYLRSHLPFTSSSSQARFPFVLSQIDRVHLNPYLKLCIYGNHAETTGTINGGVGAVERCVGRGEEGRSES